MNDETLSLLVHAGSKIGKTTLAATCPKPLLLMDAEGGSKFLPYKMVTWDPVQGPPPQADGTWEICVVQVRQFETMSLAYQWLASGQHSFHSICIDSITEVQRRCKATLDPENMRTQDWGTLLVRMESLIRDFRDLTHHPTHPISVAMFVAESREFNDQWKPYMQGQMATSFPYLVDVIGYLFVVNIIDPADPTKNAMQRQLLVSPHPQFLAGERVQGKLGDVVAEPNIERMLDMVYPNHQGEVT